MAVFHDNIRGDHRINLEGRYQELDGSRPLVVICAGGQRSTIACSLLQKHGYTQLLNVLGGMDTWNRVGFETVRE